MAMRQCFVWDKDRVVLIEGNRNGDDDYGVKSAHYFEKQRCILDMGLKSSIRYVGIF